VNYRDIAQHLAKHCRKALEGSKEHVPGASEHEDRFVVTKPVSLFGQRQEYDDPAYAFFIRGYRGDETSPSWTLFVRVSQSKRIDITPRGNVPSHVFACLEQGGA